MPLRSTQILKCLATVRVTNISLYLKGKTRESLRRKWGLYSLKKEIALQEVDQQVGIKQHSNQSRSDTELTLKTSQLLEMLSNYKKIWAQQSLELPSLKVLRWSRMYFLHRFQTIWSSKTIEGDDHVKNRGFKNRNRDLLGAVLKEFQVQKVTVDLLENILIQEVLQILGLILNENALHVVAALTKRL